MALSTSSRYTTFKDDVSGRVLAKRKKEVSVSYKTYTTRERETFEYIAAFEFGDPRQWWRIAELNPQVKFPDYIPTGTVIRVPTT